MDEDRAQLDRAREAWRKKVQQAAEGEAPDSAETQPGSGFLAPAADADGETAGSQGEAGAGAQGETARFQPGSGSKNESADSESWNSSALELSMAYYKMLKMPEMPRIWQCTGP